MESTAMAKARKKRLEKKGLRIFLLVLCSVVFVVSAGMLVYYLLWELISITRRVLKSSRFILPGG